MARPRKFGPRNPVSGRLIYERIKQDNRYPVALTRVRDFGVTAQQAVSPLAGYLAGVLYLRGEISSIHLGHYYSFLQTVAPTVRAIQYRTRVQGGKISGPSIPARSKKYLELVNTLGRDIDTLHRLSQDSLTVSIKELKAILERVPLSKGGSIFQVFCESWRGVRRRRPRHIRPSLSRGQLT